MRAKPLSPALLEGQQSELLWFPTDPTLSPP